MLAGRMRHRDNKGGEGVIEPGGIQWMTAGRGLVHSEMPEQTEGLMRGFQLWVNLPARDKLTAPGYQEFPASRIPVEEREDGVRVRVITGSTSRGTAGPVTAAATDARYFDVELPAGATFTEALPAGHAAFVVVHEGTLKIGGHDVEGVGLAQLGDGDAVRFSAADGAGKGARHCGRPLNEPVAWYGPFVMNTDRRSDAGDRRLPGRAVLTGRGLLREGNRLRGLVPLDRLDLVLDLDVAGRLDARQDLRRFLEVPLAHL